MLSVTPNTAESDITPFPITSLFLIVIATIVLFYAFAFPLYHSYVQMNTTEQQMHGKSKYRHARHHDHDMDSYG